MRNELILIVTLLVTYSTVILWFRLFGEAGMMGWTVFSTIAANIEVLILVDAFGLHQTLGNILFASTLLASEILSETAGKKKARRAVNLGILTSLCFIAVTQSWFLYVPSSSDWVMPSIRTVFSGTPRIMLASLAVYAVTQQFDVWMYAFVWKKTEKRFGTRRGYLWIRNNITLLSQVINTVLFTFGAFWGTYPMHDLISLCVSSYVIFLVTSLADNPFVYWARAIHEKKQLRAAENEPLS